MVSSRAETVEQYLAELSDDRRDAIAEVRDTIVANVPDGVVETMSYGMITYEILPETVQGASLDKPVMFAALASQKNHMALYLSAVLAGEGSEDSFRKRYLATGKKLDMGKSCVRFKKIDDLPVDLVAEVIGAVSLEEFLDGYRASNASS